MRRAARLYPRCEGCGFRIYDADLVKGTEGGKTYYWHRRHAPKGRNILGFHPITGPIRRRLAARRARKATEKGEPFKAAAASVNPKRWASGAFKSSREGALTKYGWHSSAPEGTRRAALRKLIKRDGRTAAVKRLLLPANVGNIAAHADLEWVQRTFPRPNPATFPVRKGAAFRNKFERCVMHVKASNKKYGREVNPWAACTVALGGRPPRTNPTYFMASSPHPLYETERKAARRWFTLTGPQREGWLRGTGQPARYSSTRTFMGLPNWVRSALMVSVAHGNPAKKKAGVRARIRGFKTKHPKATRALKVGAKVGVAAASVPFPEVGLASEVARRGSQAYKSRKKNPLTRAFGITVYNGWLIDGKRGEWYIRQLKLTADRKTVIDTETLGPFETQHAAMLNIDWHNASPKNVGPGPMKNPEVPAHERIPAPKTAFHYLKLSEKALRKGHFGVAEHWATEASKYSGTEGPAPPAVREQLNRIAQAVAARPPSLEGSEKRARFIRNPVTVEPPAEFWEKLVDELQPSHPATGRYQLLESSRDIWRFVLNDAAKERLTQRFEKGGKLIDSTFVRLFDDYRAGKFVSDGKGHYVPKRKNPGELPIVDGATAVEITYLDENGQLWTHEFGELTGSQPRIRVRKKLSGDTLTIGPTAVTKRGITD